jgi:hypothetical protein
MFKGINPRTFIDTCEEWHALVIGFCEVLCPWPPRQATIEIELAKAIWSEHHYYLFGRALGIFAWLGIAVIVKRLLF